MAKKTPQSRGAGKVQRSESGGAVRGRIPKPGGSNKTNHNTGISTIKYGKDKTAAKKVAKSGVKKRAAKRVAKPRKK